MIADAPVRLLGRYEILAMIGQGGSGTVYEAQDHKSGERVALKQLRLADAESLTRFKREFRALQELSHPNLVRLDALFEDRGVWTIAMELVPGSELRDHLYVDGETRCFDEARLLDAFLQLAVGLATLHAAGFIHRDLKPANVRITPEGRVVLLDFGLATAADPGQQSTRAAGFGTIAYMAPEQAASEKVGPAADWYSFGVCLYEALTGLLPVDGPNPLALLQAKQHLAVPPPSTQGSGIPDDLDRLCHRLLAIEPDQRPGGAAVCSVLRRGAASRSAEPQHARSQAARVTFSGREAELAVLEQALARAAAGITQLVLIDGESGIGKSALVAAFLDAHGDATVLRSRCYENELLAYKAFDGAMEDLASALGRLPTPDCEALLPQRAGLLCRLFPALASVPPVARSPLHGLAADPGVQQLEAFSTFARLIASLSRRAAPVLFAIDDLQWADVDSFRLLRAWLTAQPARCLVVATLRPAAELTAQAAQAIEELRALPCAAELSLSGLPQASARVFASELLGPEAAASLLEMTVKESGGHPLFIYELARFAQRHAGGAASISLDAAIADRIAALPATVRTLFETVALAGSPLAASVFGRAVELPDVELGRMVTELCRHKLLRRRGAGEIACFHDRIRRVAVESLPRAQRRTLHARIASALLSAGEVDPAEIARHHQAAGELGRALEAYRRAAEKALTTLAFARAAELYARALEVGDDLRLDAGQRIPLMVGRGDALGRAGLSAEAARQYLDAAAHAEGELKTRLQIWAAQHLLQSGQIAEGMAAARRVLADLGMPLPTSPAALRARLVLDAVLLALRGVTGSEPRVALTEIDPRMRMRLDALWTLSQPITALDLMASAGLNLRYFRIARAAGEPSHMARAFSEEAHLRALRDLNDPQVPRMLEQARRLVAMCTERDLSLLVESREIDVALLQGYPGATARLERTLASATERCPDRPWMIGHFRTGLGVAWMWEGEHARLAASLGTWIAESRALNDRFALAHLVGFAGGYLRHLMNDDPEAARRELEASLTGWPEEPFAFARFGWHHALQAIEAYRGGNQLLGWLEAQLPGLQRHMMMKVPFGQAVLCFWQIGACLMRYKACGADASAAAHLEQARRHLEVAQRLRLESALTQSFVLMSEAQLAALEGAPDAASVIEKARAACGLGVPRRCLDYLLGLVEGGPTGAERCRVTLEFFAAQGWRNPERALAMWCQAIGILEARSAV